jgi:hypothetical protein
MTNPETQITAPPKKVWLRNLLIFVCLALLGFFMWTFYDVLTSYKKQIIETEKANARYQETSKQLKDASKRSDSLSKLFNQFSRYKHAVELQLYRDTVYRYLEFRPGDIAWKKTDTSVVTVIDVYFGGGLYDYYFRYRVVDRSGKEEEVKPEVLFRKKQN